MKTKLLTCLCAAICITSQAQNWQYTPNFPPGALSDVQFWDEQLLVSTYNGQLYRSLDEGQSWQNMALPAPARPIYGLYSSKQRWFASAPGGFYTSANAGQNWQWVALPSPFVPSGFAVLGNNHWVVATADLAGGGDQASGLLRSSNMGQSWESVNANLPGTAISSMIQNATDQLVVALDRPQQTNSLFTTWLGPNGSFQWVPLPIRIFYQNDSSRADFQANEWFHLQWYNDSTLLISADGLVREPGATNAVFAQWMGFRKINTGSQAEFWVETLPFRPQFNSWWDQAAPAHLLLHSHTQHWYGSLQGGSARGGAWMRPTAAQGWSKANNGIAPGPNGWDFLQFAEGPWGRVFAIHQGQPGVYYSDFSRIWPSAVPSAKVAPFKIWPNPGTGVLHFDVLPTAASLEAFNAIGQRVWAQTYEAAEKPTADLSHLPPGVYLLRLQQGQALKHASYVHRP